MPPCRSSPPRPRLITEGPLGLLVLLALGGCDPPPRPDGPPGTAAATAATDAATGRRKRLRPSSRRIVAQRPAQPARLAERPVPLAKPSGPSRLLIVTRPRFESALRPLVALRQQEGFTVKLTTAPVAAAIAAERRAPPHYLLLVGDWAEGAEAEPWSVPTRPSFLYRWRRAQRETYAADALWGDLDGDGRPDVPVGRIPARTAAQVRRAVSKIRRYEAQTPTAGELSLPIWAGAPGYGPVVDALATSILVTVARNEAPAWIEPWIQSGDPGHALCGWPAGQVRAWNARLRRPALLGLMVGHGLEESFHSMVVKGRSVDYRVQDTGPLESPGPVGPPLVVLTCSSGRFDGTRPSLAETLLWRRAGPVAVIAATTESHPVTNYYTGVAVARALGRGERRLGRLWLDVQRRAARDQNVLVEQALLGAEGSLQGGLLLPRLRRDQERMYALLGDPATRLAWPGALTVKVSPEGANVRWRVDRPAGAQVLELGFRPRGQPFPRPSPLRPAGADAAREAANAVLRFRPLARRSGTEAWEGTFRPDRPGTLRFLAVAAGQRFVATAQLEAPPR